MAKYVRWPHSNVTTCMLASDGGMQVSNDKICTMLLHNVVILLSSRFTMDTSNYSSTSGCVHNTIQISFNGTMKTQLILIVGSGKEY